MKRTREEAVRGYRSLKVCKIHKDFENYSRFVIRASFSLVRDFMRLKMQI